MRQNHNKKPKQKTSFLRHVFLGILGIALTGVILVGIVLFYTIITLPNIQELKDAHLQVPLKIYTADKKLIGEFGEKKRTPIALSQVPPQLIRALLDTEDQRFYEHSGVDFIGLLRAARVLLTTGEKLQGASTITMQVARNFFLTRKKTYTRKLREILLALEIDRELSKNKVLELYLNKIYLGQRAYGVAAAAQIYYGKQLKDLSLPELAMIAGLPQAPSSDNPLANPKGAIRRRNHVLRRMYQKGDIDQEAYKKARRTPVTSKYHEQKVKLKAPYAAEMVRNILFEKFGNKVYEEGFKVYTTIKSKTQKAANKTLRDGLLAYSKRHGYIGPETNLGSLPDKFQEWRDRLDKLPNLNGLVAAAITEVDPDAIKAIFASGAIVTLNWADMNWVRKRQSNNMPGAKPQNPSDIFQVGDVIRVEQINKQWRLGQTPKINGALVAISPINGAIIALDGGFSFRINKFNNAIQADRQPGSSFKPFVYSAALAKGLTLATIINDAPVVMSDSGANTLWRPQNVTKKFYGPTRLKVGLIESRNLVSIRLLQTIGIPYTINYLQNFGFDPKKLPDTLSLALGTATLSPLNLATGYAVFANSGYQVKPFFINKILDEDGKTIYQAHPITTPDNNNYLASDNPNAQRVITEQNAYLMTNAMQDVIRSGTGRAALKLKRRDLAGKTGTTNNQVDAWFSGFNGDLVTTVWVGFDQPKSIREYGAQVALPIWINFMGRALRGKPNNSMRRPSDITTVRIDPKTGLLAYPGQKNAIFELFRKQYAPTQSTQNSDNSNSNSGNNNSSNDAELF
ncbi:MAG: penicillin-binding protein 1A [Gammaproteobacteria bacterium]|nr:penicillin-binding protein 1A [Gammaproteobacteria bacterium]